jgi:cytoskeletal protein CcmA (bactofilin family)
MAGEFREDENIVHIKADEVIEDDLYAFGEQVIIDGVVKGDVIAFGRIVKLNGTVEGDLIAGAQSVIVGGEVKDDARVGAQFFVLNGTVGDDINAGVFAFEGGPESEIGGDLLMGGYQALVAGSLTGDLIGGFAGLKISGAVGGNVDVEVDQDTGGPSPLEFMDGIPDMPSVSVVPQGLTVSDDATIGGQLKYRSPAQGKINKASIGGGVEYIEERFDPTTREEQQRGGNWIWGQIQRLLRLLLFGALAVWVAPLVVSQASHKLQAKLWPSLGWGVGTLIIFPIALTVVALVGFLINFPFLFFGTLLFGYLFVLFYIGAVVVGQTFGRAILQRARPEESYSDMIATLVGLLAVWVITVIPILGPIVGFVVALFGVGSLAMVGYERFSSGGGEQVVVMAS